MNSRVGHASLHKWKSCSMDAFTRITAVLVKITLKIIEQVIRAVLHTVLTITAIGAVMTTGVVISYALLRYGAYNEEICMTSRSLGGLILVAGWACVAYATYTTMRRLL